MYDIFYIGNNTELKEKYPFSRQVDDADSIKSNTALYWLVESNTSITDWDIFEFKPDQYTVNFEHKWKWNDENYGGVVLIPKAGGNETVFHNKIVCKKQFDILLQETPGEYFEGNPHSSHVWCVDPQYVLGDDINWAPGNFEPDFIHSFHLRGQLEFKYPELEGGIKLYPREWLSAQFKYHKFLDTKVDYPIMYVKDIDDYAQRDIYKDEYVWLIDRDYSINQDTVDWVPNPFEKEFIHCFKMPYQLKEKYPMAMGGIKLVPVNWKEAELKIHPACPIEDEAYDVFYIDEDEFNSDTYNEYASRSKTDWFWVVDRDYTFNGKLLFVPAVHEQEYIHVFKIPGHLEERYPTDVKEPWDIRCGGVRLVNKQFDMTKHKFQEDVVPARYDIFYVEDLNDYATPARKSRTKMFWLVDSEHQINEEFKYVPQRYDQKYIQVFKFPGDLEHKYPRNITNISDNRAGGIKLVPVNGNGDSKFIDENPVGGRSYPIKYSDDPDVEVTEDTWIVPESLKDIITSIPWQPSVFEKETKHVFGSGLLRWHPLEWNGEIKEHDFSPVIIDITYEVFSSYEEGLRNSKFNWFWVVSPDVTILENFDWNFQPNVFDEGKPHVWQKLNPITNKQYDYGGVELRHKVEKKGRPKYIREHACTQNEYPVYTLTAEDYENGLKLTYDKLASKTKTEMFWVVDAFVNVDDQFDFSYYPTQYDSDVVHAWQHASKNRASGIRLMPVNTEIIDDAQIIENGFSKLKLLPEIATTDSTWPVETLKELTATEVQSILDKHNNVPYVWTLEPGFELEEKLLKNSFLPHSYHYDLVHVWKNQGTSNYGGVRLWPTNYNASNLTNEQVSTCSIPDQFIMDTVAGPQAQFPVYTTDSTKSLKELYTDFQTATDTRMFWVVDDLVDVNDDFDFTYCPSQFDMDTVHSWTHESDNRLSGVRLVPTTQHIKSTKQIFENSFDKLKTIDTTVSKDKVWSVVQLKTNTVDEIKTILKEHNGYVWTVNPGTEVDQDTINQSFIPHIDNVSCVHVWKDADGGYGSLKLWPAHYNIDQLTDEQVSTSSIPDQVIMDTVAAQQTQYPIYYLDTFDLSNGLQGIYERLATDTDSRMFWVVDSHTEIVESFDFAFKPSQFDMDTVHVWQHAGETRSSAVRLIPTGTKFKHDQQIVDNSFDKLKQIPQVASRDPIWPVVKLTDLTAKEITGILAETQTSYVWTVEPGIELDKDLVERSYVPDYYHNNVVHVWKNQGTDGYGGLRLWPSDFDASSLSDDQVATCSIPEQFILDSEAGPQKQFPVYFLTNRDYDRGLLTVYKELAENTDTRMFWVVEANIQVDKEFDFGFIPSQFDMDVVHVWEHSGSTLQTGVKLIPKNIELKHDQQILENQYNKLKTINVTASYDNTWPLVTLSKLNVEQVKKVLSTNKNSAYVWTHDVNIDLDQSVIDKSYVPNYEHRNNVHVWKNNDAEGYGGLRLWPTNYNVELLSDEQVLTCSIPEQFILDSTAGSQKLYPVYHLTADDVRNGLKETYEKLSAQTETRMFWVVDAFVEVNEDFDFTYAPSQFDTDVVHVWKHASTSRQTGVRLMPTDLQYDSDIQINDNSFPKLKQISTIASHDPVWPIEKFESVDVDNLKHMLNNNSNSDFMWTVDPDIDLDESVIQQSIIPHLNNINAVHVWKRTNSEGLVVGHGGLRLWPTWFNTDDITDDQLITSSIPEQVILDSVAGPQKEFPILELCSTKDILEQIKQFEAECDSTMYWCVDPNVTYVDDWKFDYIPTKWEEHVVHVFLDSNDDARSVRLIPTGTITDNDITVKHIVNNSFEHLKVVYRHATRPTVLPVYSFNTQSNTNTASNGSLKQQLETFSKQAKGKPFFTIDDDVTVVDNFEYAYTAQLDSADKTHVWQRLNPRTGNTHSYGGVRMWPNPPTLALRELTTDRIKMNRMDARKLQYVKQPGSSFTEYSIVMLSYQEDIELVEQRIQRIQQQTGSDVIHVRGVEGIFNAHKAAAGKVNSSMFWVVDADAHIKDDFDFSYIPDAYDHEVVHVWASENPITGMEYGYGGVKLFNTQQVLDATSWGLDFTTGLSSRFKAMPEVSCVTRFNTDAYSTWRSAFRECVKLSMNNDDESKKRLQGWLHPVPDADFRHDAKLGAEQGVAHAKQHANNSAQLANINDFNWLWEMYHSDTA